MLVLTLNDELVLEALDELFDEALERGDLGEAQDWATMLGDYGIDP